MLQPLRMMNIVPRHPHIEHLKLNLHASALPPGDDVNGVFGNALIPSTALSISAAILVPSSEPLPFTLAPPLERQNG